MLYIGWMLCPTIRHQTHQLCQRLLEDVDGLNDHSSSMSAAGTQLGMYACSVLSLMQWKHTTSLVKLDSLVHSTNLVDSVIEELPSRRVQRVHLDPDGRTTVAKPLCDRGRWIWCRYGVCVEESSGRRY